MSPRAVSLLRTASQRARTPGTAAVLAGSMASGVGAYLFQVVGTRTLGDEGYAPISVLWTIQYLVLTIALLSVEAYVTRAVTLHASDAAALRRGVKGLAIWTVGVSAALCAATWKWAEALFHGDGSGEFAVIAGLIVLSFGAYVIIRGWLAGSYRFAQYGMATGIESMGRVALVLPIALFAPSPELIAWTLPLGPFLVVLWWWLAVHNRPFAGPRRPPSLPEADAGENGSTSRYLAATTIANVASQTLLAAGPLVLLPLGASAAETSVFFVTSTAARAPLVFAIGGVLSRVLPPLTRVARAGEYARLRRIALWTVVTGATLAALAAVVASWIGPTVIALLFGGDFRPDRWFIALTAAGVVGATAALGLNQILIAMSAESRLIGPWTSALLAGALTIAVTGGSPTMRVVTAFVVGEAVALLGLISAILSAHPAPTASSPAPVTALHAASPE
ncbi:MAG: lipopolysaccharide biosynthesis protein [Egibacteraceae bacterium]